MKLQDHLFKMSWVAALLMMPCLFSCSDEIEMEDNQSNKEATYYGDKVNLGNGTVRSYITLDKYKNPKSIGFNFTEEALDGLSSSTDPMDNMYMLNLPAEASISGYQHLEINWNPEGHEPLEVYGLPHFDFHFYLVGAEELAKVESGPDTTPVSSEFIPMGYVSGVESIPNMGVHWVDSNSDEFKGKQFSKTFVYGFYKGKMLFVEPMITRAFLKTNPKVSYKIKQPDKFQNHAWYPEKYSIIYKRESKEYFVSLDKMTEVYANAKNPLNFPPNKNKNPKQKFPEIIKLEPQN